MTAPAKGLCRSCGAPLLWVVTPAGKHMPLDEKPVDGGNISIESGRAVVTPHRGTHTTHFATCPNAAKHRRSPARVTP